KRRGALFHGGEPTPAPLPRGDLKMEYTPYSFISSISSRVILVGEFLYERDLSEAQPREEARRSFHVFLILAPEMHQQTFLFRQGAVPLLSTGPREWRQCLLAT
ncbi:MAG TPA: hypothetical protein VF790_09340, partial [Dissulfurispiraceae bacterium]